jgi:hypothetical protein
MKRRDRRLSAALGIVSAAGALMTIFVRHRFDQKLDALDQQLANAQQSVEARTDLPPAVTDLARRLGASNVNTARCLDIRQSGTMWFKPGGSPQRFTARQRFGTSRSGFVWRAKIGLLGAISVVDSFVESRGLLEARIVGAFSLAQEAGTAAVNQGEAVRYLAELPLNPDAMLLDHALTWSVENSRTIKVSMGHGIAQAQITFELDDAGLIHSASAASRTFGQTGKHYPWRGRFWDYQEMSGRLIPTQAEVGWVIDGQNFIYWRGKIERWDMVPAKMGSK